LIVILNMIVTIVLQATTIIIGPLGRTNLIMEVEEFWRNSAWSLSVIPGNQTILLSKTPLAILISMSSFQMIHNPAMESQILMVVFFSRTRLCANSIGEKL
jgi:hypothetical protein